MSEPERVFYLLACHWRRNERFDLAMLIVWTFCGVITSQIMNNEKFAGFSKWHAGGDA